MTPRFSVFAAVAVLLCTSVISSRAQADGEPTRPTNPNAVSLEVMGRTTRWSVNYDRAVNDDFVAGVGFGNSLVDNSDGTDAGITANMIPLYLNYYLWREAGSIYGSAGVNFVLNPRDIDQKEAALSNLKYSKSGVIPVIGVGYENRGEYGFLFRLAGYVLIDRNVAPWLGVSFGYAF